MENAANLSALLRVTYSLWRNELDRRLKPFGLSQAKWLVLLNLSVHSKVKTQTELAQCLGIEGPTLVGLLNRLAKDGWLTRCEAPADRRTKTVHLTPKAIEMSKKMQAIAEQLREELMVSISESDMLVSIKVLKQIKQQLI